MLKSALYCAGPHEGPEVPPEAPAVGATAALCDSCGAVSQICPRSECQGRTRAGGYRCRTCGQVLEPAWRERSWRGTASRSLHAASHVRSFEVDTGSAGASHRVQLLGTDSWTVLVAGQQVWLLDPGPGLGVVLEVRLGSDEVAIDLLQDPAHATWQLLTSRRLLVFEPHAGSWKPKPLPGELLWHSRGLWAFRKSSGSGQVTELRRSFEIEPFHEESGLLSSPAWLSEDLFVCQAGNAIVFGSLQGVGNPARIPANGVTPFLTPAFERQSARVYLPGTSLVQYWHPKAQSVAPFVRSGGGMVQAFEGRVVLIESDRMQVFDPGGRSSWDSKLSLSDFGRAPQHFDVAGDFLLVPMSTGRGNTELLLFSPLRPKDHLRATIEGTLLADPRLVPGGIVVAVQGNQRNRLDLVWMTVKTEGQSAS